MISFIFCLVYNYIDAMLIFIVNLNKVQYFTTQSERSHEGVTTQIWGVNHYLQIPLLDIPWFCSRIIGI